MTAAEKWLVVALVAVVAAACAALAGGTVKLGGDVELDTSSTGATTTRGDRRPHTCKPHQMARVLNRPHPLYRRPSSPRPGASALMAHSWRAWITDPPSEATL